MSVQRQRWVLVGGGLALLVAVATAVAARDVLREEWYLRRLGAESEESRIAALEGLLALRSRRAVPRLLELIRRDQRERAEAPMVMGSGECSNALDVLFLPPACHVLYHLGEDAAGTEVARAVREEEQLETPSSFCMTLYEVQRAWGTQVLILSDHRLNCGLCESGE